MKSSVDARQPLLAALRREVARFAASRPPAEDRLISTGSADLDRLLPAHGFQPGSLVEYLFPGLGMGGEALALGAAREACREGRALVVLDPPKTDGTSSVPRGRFYPPAAAAWGIDLSRLLVLRPANQADALWALDQALRCPGVGAVWAAWDRLTVRDFRRLQLAAESGGTLGLLLRPNRYRGQPTWAEVQWEVRTEARERMKEEGGWKRATWDSGGWRLQVELVRCRGGSGGKTVVLELDEAAGIWKKANGHATHSVPRSAQLAHPASRRRA